MKIFMLISHGFGIFSIKAYANGKRANPDTPIGGYLTAETAKIAMDAYLNAGYVRLRNE